MAYVLILDDSEVAARAMHGILARGHHTCIVATNGDDAWRLLRDGVIFDLVIVELKLAQPDGLVFLQRLRDDWFWKNLPVVVYTYETDASRVKRALGLRVQNYLIKPYNDDLIHAEIAKARLSPWRDQQFEEAKSFCVQRGYTPPGLARMRTQVMNTFAEASREFPLWAEDRDNEEVFARIDALVEDARTAGVSAGLDFLHHLRQRAEQGDWTGFGECGEPLDFACRMIFHQINPKHVPDCLRTERERTETREAVDRVRWEHADVDANGPVVRAAELEKQVLSLTGCPVIETAAAAFQMAADRRVSSMSPVMDLVTRDPGLCAQVLAAANRGHDDEMSTIEDPQAAATQLGELKLNALVKTLPIVPERHLLQPPMTWSNYSMFLIGVGKVSEFVCNYLDLSYLASNAFTAGLLHDLGKSVLLKLHPFGFHAIVSYAKDKKIPLHAAERKYLECTSRDLGLRFAQHVGLPAVYRNVIRWVEQPDLATANTDLVAIVSLARHITLHNHVGYCGDTPGDSCPPVTTTPAWQMLQPRLFPSFDLKKFEAQAHAYCLTLRQELSGSAGKLRSTREHSVA